MFVYNYKATQNKHQKQRLCQYKQGCNKTDAMLSVYKHKINNTTNNYFQFQTTARQANHCNVICLEYQRKNKTIVHTSGKLLNKGCDRILFFWWRCFSMCSLWKTIDAKHIRITSKSFMLQVDAPTTLV